MEQQAPQPRQGGTNDVTIMVVLFVVVTLALVAGFYLALYKPKVNDIKQMNSQLESKKSQLRNYIAEVKDLKNYEDQLDILDVKWQKNKHYYVLGDPSTFDPQDAQFEIFKAYDHIFDLGAFAGVEIISLKVSEAFKYYMHDKPWDLPPNLLKFEWEPVFAERQTEEGVEKSTQLSTSMITAHSFTATMRGTYNNIRRFIEVVQNMEGEKKLMMSIHCYRVSEEPSYYFYPIRYTNVGGGGGGSNVLYDVSVEVEMLMTFYELNEKGTPSGVPDVPGTVACSFGGGGGGGGGGGPTPAGGGRGGGTMSMG